MTAPAELDTLTALAALTVMVLGSFWASSPRGLIGPFPTILNLAGGMLIIYEQLLVSIVVLVAAGAVRSILLQQQWPRSIVAGAALGMSAALVASGWAPTGWLLIAGSIPALLDGSASFDELGVNDRQVLS